MNTLKTLLLPVGIGLGLLALLGVLGSTLFLFREANAVHPILGWTVVGLLLAALYLLVLAPVLKLLSMPKPIRRPAESSGPEWTRYVQRYADRLLGNPRLAEWEGRDELEVARAAGPEDLPRLEAAVESALAQLDRIANQTIRTHAAAVFVATGASQSGRLDVGIVLSTQLRMVREIAVIYYQRPGPRELWSLYSNVGGSAFLAGEIQDSEVLAVLGAPVSAALSGFVPVSGTGPLISLLVHSLLDGSANALLTLRVGVIARRSCGLRLEPSRSQLSRSASMEAASLLAGVVATGASRIAAVTRKLIVRSTVHAPQTAAKGVVDAGTTVVSGLARAASRVGSRALGLGREAMRQVSGAPSPPTALGSPGSRLGEAPGAQGGPLGSDAPRGAPASMRPADLPGPEDDPDAADPARPATPARRPTERESELVLADTARFWERVAEIFAP